MNPVSTLAERLLLFLGRWPMTMYSLTVLLAMSPEAVLVLLCVSLAADAYALPHFAHKNLAQSSVYVGSFGAAVALISMLATIPDAVAIGWVALFAVTALLYWAGKMQDRRRLQLGFREIMYSGMVLGPVSLIITVEFIRLVSILALTGDLGSHIYVSVAMVCSMTYFIAHATFTVVCNRSSTAHPGESK
jgi:hypothetical protein